MATYLMLLRIPEWKALQREQRAFVQKHCVQPLLTSTLAIGLKTLIMAIGVYAATLLGLMEHLSTSVPVMLAACFVPGELVDMVFVARNRALICSFIQGHATEWMPSGNQFLADAE